jgi:FkbM family methyltransferase
MGRLTDAGQLQVRTVALDRMVRDGALPTPDLIKIDVEGGEKRVLEGAQEVLSRAHPTVFLATHGGQMHTEVLRASPKP